MTLYVGTAGWSYPSGQGRWDGVFYPESLADRDKLAFYFHGRNYAQWWQHEAPEDRYNYLYTGAEQRELAREVGDVARRTEDTYVFYNNHYRAKAVVNALQLEMEFGQTPRAPIPETLRAEYPELAGALTQPG